MAPLAEGGYMDKQEDKQEDKQKQARETSDTLQEAMGSWVAVAIWCTWLLWLVGFSVLPSDAIAGMLVASSALWLCLMCYRQGMGRLGTMAWQWLGSTHKLWVDQYVLLYLVLILLATGWSSYGGTSLVGCLKYLLMVVPAYGFTRLACQGLENQGFQRWHPLVLLSGVGVVQALIGLYQYKMGVAPQATWVDPTTLPEHQLTRVFGTLQPLNPNLYAGFLLPASVAAMVLGVLRPLWAMAVLPRLLGVSRVAVSLKPYLWGLGASGVMVLSVLLSGCRGAYVAVGAMMVASYLGIGHLIWYYPLQEGLQKARQVLQKVWYTTALALTSVAVGALLLSPALLNRFLSIGKMAEDSSIAYRFHVYQSVLRMIQDHWLWGIGPGNDTFKKVYGFYMHSGFNALGAYSVPLECFVEFGLGGILWFLSLGALILFRLIGLLETWHTLPQTSVNLSVELSTLPHTQASLQRDTARWVLLASGLALLVLMLHGMVDTVWFRPPIQCVFWMLLAVFATASQTCVTTVSAIASKNSDSL
jgi:putative inorganic carbon (HCO3(-)) transporter